METAPPRPIGSMLGRLVKEVVEVVTAADAVFDIRAMLQIIGEEVDINPDEATTTCS